MSEVSNTDSILNSVKHMLGIEPEYNHFDNDIIAAINTSLSILEQAGVGTIGFMITDTKQTWQNFLGENYPEGQMAKTFVCLKSQLIFDPPLNSSVAQLKERELDELIWRLNVQLDKEVTNQ